MRNSKEFEEKHHLTVFQNITVIFTNKKFNIINIIHIKPFIVQKKINIHFGFVLFDINIYKNEPNDLPIPFIVPNIPNFLSFILN